MGESTVLTAIQQIFSRFLFSAHSFLVIWRVVDVEGLWYYWLILLGILLLLLEMIVLLKKRKDQIWKWFSPSVCIYLAMVVPCIWILELDRIDQYNENLANGTAAVAKVEAEVGLSQLKGIEIPLELSPELWVLSFEQMLLFILVISRWLMPKDNITHDQLSQLLFVYIGIVSDILELFVLFEESYVIQDDILVYVILGIWTMSLLQFSFVHTSTIDDIPTGSTTTINATTRVTPIDEDIEVRHKSCCLCCETEVWSIVLAMFLQDAPYLGVRLYVMIKNKTITYSILFFTFKNALVIAMQLYRIIVLMCFHKDKK